MPIPVIPISTTPGARLVPKAGSDGKIASGWIPDLSGIYAALVHTHAAGAIVSGTIDAARLPDLSSVYQPLNATLTGLNDKSVTGSGDIVLANAPTLVNTSITQDVDILSLYHNKTGASDDTVGLSFDLNNSAASRVTYGRINLVNTGNTAGAEDGTFLFSVRKAGVLTELMRLRGSSGVVFNELGGDIDVRMEGDTNANLFFLDASADRIGIKNAAPTFDFDVTGTFRATTSVNTATVTASGTVSGLLLLAQTAAAGAQVVGQFRNTDSGATSTTRVTWGNTATANLFNLYTTNSTHATYPTSVVMAIGTGGGFILEQGGIPAISVVSVGNFFTASSNLTNNPNIVHTFRHISTGSVVNGFGFGLAFELSSSTTANQRAATIDALWQDATHASRLGNLVFNVYNVSTKTMSLTLTPTEMYIPSGNAFYIGAPTTDGTWRFTRSGNNLLIQRRESGSYVTKSTIAA